MKDNRDRQMPQFAGWTWELNGYAAKVPFYNADNLTMREVQNVFQLDPEPPQMELNDYICEAVRHKDLAYFSFFLHHFEKRLNSVIYRFLTRSGIDRYDPAQETEFLKYAKHYIQDGLLFCRMMGEAGSFASLAEYRRVRQIGAIYNGSGKSRAEVVSEFAVQSGYKDESVSADELLTIAQRNRSIVSLYRTEQDEDGEETTSKKKKKTTTEVTEETTEEATSKKKKSTTADTSEETSSEETAETTKKKSKKTTTETTAEETTSKKKKSTAKETAAETSDTESTEESAVTGVPETESEETTTVTAGSD